jgi:hypothetical protein
MQTSVKVNLKGKEFVVNYPNVGEKIKIENYKVLLTNGQYGDFVRSGHKTCLDLLDLVDAFSNFAILIKELNLGIDDFNNMDLKTSSEIKIEYTKVLYPFLTNLEKQLEEVTINKDDNEPSQTS